MKPILALLLLLSSPLAHAALADLEYVSEEYPPYNYTEQGQVRGLAVDLLKAVWQRTNTPAQHIRLMPWARGYYLLTQKPNVVLFSTARTRAREAQFKWACPIGYSEYGLWALRANAPTIKAESDLNRYTVAAVRADASEQLLLNKGMDDTRIQPANRLAQAFKMLRSKRVDLIASGSLAARDAMRELKLNPDDYQQVYVLSAEQLCYAFSPAVPDSDVKAFQDALTRTLASQEYETLRKRYLP